MSRIGLIQTRGIGDIIIALPIADYFIEQGAEVFWPVDERFAGMFCEADPRVNFLPVPTGNDMAYFVDTPLARLKESGCEQVFTLYNQLRAGQQIIPGSAPGYTRSLKFDEYKYAVTGVPFSRKWSLRIDRNPQREKALHDSLKIDRRYICVHTGGSNVRFDLQLPRAMTEQYQIIEISERSDNVFDWLHTLEHADKLVLIDSCFANLVEQLNWATEKYLLLRSVGSDTPVYRNGWRFVAKGMKIG